MAIKYLDAKRIRGVASEKAALITAADAGWTDNDSARIDVTGGALTWEMKRDGTNDSTIYDLTSTSANWVLRFKVSGSNYNTTIQAGNGFFFGFRYTILQNY